MSEPLSIYTLIADASLLVQIVMALLAAVSIASWVMIFQRWRALDRVQLELNEFEDYFWSGIDLRELHKDLGNDTSLTGIETVFVSGFTEFQRLSEQPNTDPDSIMQGVQRVMRVEVSREEEQLEKHLGFLATVGSTSPYVGLFGTVWGIMNSFRALGNVHQATLAMVAPGIAEALIATAMGLFAAIPAVVAYNRYANDVERLTNRYDTFVEEFSTILQRQAHN